MGLIALAVGVIGLGAVVAAVTVFAVLRSRRNSANGGPINGSYPQNMGYPPHQPMYPTAQQPYPTPAPNQGYPTLPGQPQQNPNPHTRQSPYPGQ